MKHKRKAKHTSKQSALARKLHYTVAAELLLNRKGRLSEEQVAYLTSPCGPMARLGERVKTVGRWLVGLNVAATLPLFVIGSLLEMGSALDVALVRAYYALHVAAILLGFGLWLLGWLLAQLGVPLRDAVGQRVVSLTDRVYCEADPDGQQTRLLLPTLRKTLLVPNDVRPFFEDGADGAVYTLYLVEGSDLLLSFERVHTPAPKRLHDLSDAVPLDVLVDEAAQQMERER